MADDVQVIQIANGNPFHVRCDGDGWMIIQQRINGGQDFNRSWQEYVDGFGDLNGDFFIGLEKLHLLTTSTRHKLNISLTYEWIIYDSDKHDVQYDDFRIGDLESSYELESIGKFTGHRFMNGFEGNEKQKFSTYDRNGPTDSGGWWYSDLNYR
ncbi:hypothetical protein KR044_010273 [Drosophila immigrans]|nr:hypothetical protein KR044_010273 [Drosophila immigrans]